ncbi:uncharacterized protein DUF547 [Neolewinella xylanilytica]|uniref:Uncharacterized protein DUF547 n=1 Tax=Neolewinella xylanilytica TaxID=1514080 RepID=A0A2S6I961_9BACT|nr:DUF547 domain-containing protein [Neolewinella xylanilytica]PPK88031.1 uncharacterized protein DUF547 [Neolewinella xylanilytica]
MYRLLSLSLLLLTACGTYQADTNFDPETSPNQLSQQFLEGLKVGRDVDDIVDRLATYEPGNLAAALDTRSEKLAFWVNVYNGMVQYLLTEEPARYDDRSAFFSTPRFTVAGHALSPNDIEHGIIRGGENRLGLGFIPQLFTDKFSRTFRIKGGDSRIHFALNCGASDCPPVAIYRPETYDEQIDTRVRAYLAEHATVEERDGQRVLVTSPLFSWFRGDFRDRGGVDDFLVAYGVLEDANKNLDREYENYDWTLETGIWAE